MDIFVKVENVEADSEFMDAQLAHSDEQIEIEESDVKQERLDVKEEWLTEDSVVDNVKNEDSAPPPDGLLKKCRGLEDSIKIAGYSEGNGVVHSDTTGVKSLKSREHYWSSLVDDNNSRADIPRSKTNKRTTESQFIIMVQCMEQNGDLARPRNVPGGRLANEMCWANLTKQLNADSDGGTKNETQWKKVWADLKNNTKKKSKRICRDACTTGGGPAPRILLGHIEERVIKIIGSQDAARCIGLPEVGLSLAPGGSITLSSTQKDIAPLSSTQKDIAPTVMPPPPVIDLPNPEPSTCAAMSPDFGVAEIEIEVLQDETPPSPSELVPEITQRRRRLRPPASPFSRSRRRNIDRFVEADRVWKEYLKAHHQSEKERFERQEQRLERQEQRLERQEEIARQQLEITRRHAEAMERIAKALERLTDRNIP